MERGKEVVMATKKKISKEGTTTVDDEAPDISTIASWDTTATTVTVDPASSTTTIGSWKYYTCPTVTPGLWDTTYVSPTISSTLRDAASEGVTPYADGFLPHLVRAKEEGIRKGVEMDTIVIDRGVAVSIGLDLEKSHVDMILGLKVRYAKENSLPMDSAFVLLKEKERTLPVSGTTGKEILGSRHDATSSCGKRFISFPCDKDKKPILLSVDKIVCVEDKYVDGDPSLGWIGLEITFEIAGKERVIVIKDKEVAKHVWNDLRTSRIYE